MKFVFWVYDVLKLDVCVYKEEFGLVKGIYQLLNEWNFNKK